MANLVGFNVSLPYLWDLKVVLTISMANLVGFNGTLPYLWLTLWDLMVVLTISMANLVGFNGTLPYLWLTLWDLMVVLTISMADISYTYIKRNSNFVGFVVLRLISVSSSCFCLPRQGTINTEHQ